MSVVGAREANPPGPSPRRDIVTARFRYRLAGAPITAGPGAICERPVKQPCL